MKLPFRGAVDCDIHPTAPPMSALLRYMSEYWSDQLQNRHVDRMGFAMTSNNPLLPIHGRPDWKPKGGAPGSDLAILRSQALDAFGTELRDLQHHPWRGRAVQWRYGLGHSQCLQ